MRSLPNDAEARALMGLRQIGNLIHALQGERACSVAYLVTKNAPAETLIACRAATDAEQAEASRVIRTPLARTAVPSNELADARHKMLKLFEIREHVERRDIDPAHVLEFITDMNESLLVLGAVLVETIADTRTRAELIAFIALLRAKELSGIERAEMSQVFHRGRFSSGEQLWLMALVAAQESLHRIAARTSAEFLGPQLARLGNDITSREITDIETHVFIHGASDFVVDPDHWHSIATRRLDLFKELENAHCAHIEQRLDARSPSDIERDIHIDAALTTTIVAMRQLRGQVDQVRSGDYALREFMRGQGDALSSAEQQLETAFNNEELTERATHDDLTGLANRSVVDALILTSLQRSRVERTGVAVMMLDLDHFKVVNDSLGHHTGDHLLCAVADRLRSSVRPSDTIARVGGDEFVVVCEPVNSPDQAQLIAERMINAVSTPYSVDGRELTVGLSVGVAMASATTSTDDLLRGSDLAAYRAKASGRGRVAFFDRRLQSEMDARLEIEQGLRRAIGRGDIVAHFQPIVRLDDGLPVATEALARWHRDGEIITASVFCPVAAEAGLMQSLDEAIVRSAFGNRPSIDGVQSAVSINVSDVQLRQPHFAEQLREDMLQHGLRASEVWVEITEHVALDSPTAVANLERLRAWGCSIALDDFGSGFSALSVLQTLPIDIVKLDGLFVTELAHDPATRAIVESVLTIISALGMSAVAEGVETIEQLNILRELGCDMAQGYFIARPATDATNWHFPTLTPVHA